MKTFLVLAVQLSKQSLLLNDSYTENLWEQCSKLQRRTITGDKLQTNFVSTKQLQKIKII